MSALRPTESEQVLLEWPCVSCGAEPEEWCRRVHWSAYSSNLGKPAANIHFARHLTEQIAATGDAHPRAKTFLLWTGDYARPASWSNVRDEIKKLLFAEDAS